jgi:hypothetical protein
MAQDYRRARYVHSSYGKNARKWRYPVYNTAMSLNLHKYVRPHGIYRFASLFPYGCMVAMLAISVLAIPAQAQHELPDLGVNADLHGKPVFPKDNPWNQRVDKSPVDPMSDLIIARMGVSLPLQVDFGSNRGGTPFGLAYVIVPDSQPKVPVYFDNTQQSDSGPYPIPLDAPIEGGQSATGERHVLVIDRDDWRLYEVDKAYLESGGWSGHCGATFDLLSDELRPEGWEAADESGLPIFPGLVRYDEAGTRGEIDHALRFTVRQTRAAYVPPARRSESKKKDEALPPMGMRLRLKASFDVTHFPPEAKAILVALKKYGMILGDNGDDFALSGTADDRWNDLALATLSQVTAGDFEVVQMDGLVTDKNQSRFNIPRL